MTDNNSPNWIAPLFGVWAGRERTDEEVVGEQAEGEEMNGTVSRQHQRRTLLGGLLCAFFLASIVPLTATSLVVLRTPKTLVLAADSGETYTVGADSELVCKILPVGRFWVAVAGLYGNEDNSFSVFEILKSLEVTSDSISKTASRIQTAVGQPLVTYLNYWYRRSPSQFQSFLSTRNGLTTSFFLVGYEKGVPSAFNLTFVVRSTDLLQGPVLTAFTRQCPGAWCPKGEIYEVAGSIGPTIKKILQPPMAAWLKKADANAARRMVQTEIDDSKGDVIPPINVLAFGKRGQPHWDKLDPKSPCPDLK